ncbi:XTP/dITP diphosphatase [Anaerosalibacter bizertensis]|uniref:dITP/XTP pyrophosphatase n=1 Tax=Anaerosalibacter bizertensis TaxID=932217 RepID=A0A9Q4AAL0_9FIRM|nr:XTP/dITP diphosphatase [Anaerosalibacter bizertensis]MBV1819619.1 XTP/dITP diphosphatase [Bacteroidales bacterium MSK.15.36]MCB5558721.1 XTP/dITP diphosphatase [Anaerosalibacter bizertensis]MCG4564121.1 XTP/dITP diphosphatase [Anaerosalibacter bizertensis]MCG4582573.1 XTP/dITP diphosphatase [Anaerosalibacter bizertensis]MCG4584644.1 XTP/dITP diphosphatase [Anaerosalibacter bizertensis]
MKNKKIILSTGNIDKIEEIKDILKDLPFSIHSKKEVGLGDLEVEEDGDTLEENAIKKAMAISERVDGIVIADDTGLFVDKLNGAPGVYSSRYAGEDVSYEDNNRKLLKELEGTPSEERTAKFQTVIAIVTEDKKIKTVYGECRGRIGFEVKGSEGFGYDPLFIVDGYGKTFAQLGEEVKNKISHRAKALEKLKKELEKLAGDD